MVTKLGMFCQRVPLSDGSQSVLSNTRSYSLLVSGPVPSCWTRTACMMPPATASVVRMHRDPGRRAHRNRTHLAGSWHGELLILRLTRQRRMI
ncbi:uncharacterized protein LOC127874888 [Dreissena polymorpha]|uniref:uncharacterized protein LOC127874888 n=1 Tax=Dreissena polymorpha TaxID=45954 RepID=UPI0022647AF4|nr:uncharacterized protein LOC127874888 [Dreissena polymorpha]